MLGYLTALLRIALISAWVRSAADLPQSAAPEREFPYPEWSWPYPASYLRVRGVRMGGRVKYRG
jgi:hypothetical protein